MLHNLDIQRTFAKSSPYLMQSYAQFAQEMSKKIRLLKRKKEHIWNQVIHEQEALKDETIRKNLMKNFLNTGMKKNKKPVKVLNKKTMMKLQACSSKGSNEFFRSRFTKVTLNDTAIQNS
jgi:aromatic ring-opening dioxygenase catalytic subunit (LigB family)